MAAGDIDGDRKAEVIIAGTGPGETVEVFSATRRALNGSLDLKGWRGLPRLMIHPRPQGRRAMSATLLGVGVGEPSTVGIGCGTLPTRS